MTRHATQPELLALTHTNLALALLAAYWAPGYATIPAAVLTYYALTATAAKTLHWDLPHTLDGTHRILRTHTANLIQALAWLITALATATLHALATAHRHTLPAA